MNGGLIAALGGELGGARDRNRRQQAVSGRRAYLSHAMRPLKLQRPVQERSGLVASISRRQTKSWFFAAARASAGPPISMFRRSLQARATRQVASNDRGWTPQIDRRDPVACSAPHARQVAAAENAAMDCGTSVFTRPSGFGSRVSETSTTAISAARSAFAEPPVDRISTPPGPAPDEFHQASLVGHRDQGTAMATMSVMRGGIASQAEQVQVRSTTLPSS